MACLPSLDRHHHHFPLKFIPPIINWCSITITSPLKFILPIYTDALLKRCLGYFNENFLMAKQAPNIDLLFSTSILKFSRIFFWYCSGRLCNFLISPTAKFNSAFVMSFVTEVTTFVIVASSLFSEVFSFFLK